MIGMIEYRLMSMFTGFRLERLPGVGLSPTGITPCFHGARRLMIMANDHRHPQINCFSVMIHGSPHGDPSFSHQLPTAIFIIGV
jgi:hypothetical protein